MYVKGQLARSTVRAGRVGSRNATPQAISNAEAFAQIIERCRVVHHQRHGARHRCAAHRGALRDQVNNRAQYCRGRHGLDKVYPAANRELAHMLAQQGALISEFRWHATATCKFSAPQSHHQRLESGMPGGGSFAAKRSLITDGWHLNRKGCVAVPVRYTRRKAKAVTRCSNRAPNWLSRADILRSWAANLSTISKFSCKGMIAGAGYALLDISASIRWTWKHLELAAA